MQMSPYQQVVTASDQGRDPLLQSHYHLTLSSSDHKDWTSPLELSVNIDHLVPMGNNMIQCVVCIALKRLTK